MKFDINNPAPTQDQIEAYRVGLLAKRQKKNIRLKQLLNLYMGLLVLAIFVISYRHSFNFMSLFSDPAFSKQLFAPFIFTITFSYFTAKHTKNSIFNIDSYIMDLEVLSPVENQQEFAKFKSMASTSKPIAEYLKSINETGRHPVRAELYAAEDLSA